jgi:hypothetical protein
MAVFEETTVMPVVETCSARNVQVASVPAGSALVIKNDPVAHADRFLHVTETGIFQWAQDPSSATVFPSMREATRMAMRLPAGDRAFGVPAQRH